MGLDFSCKHLLLYDIIIEGQGGCFCLHNMFLEKKYVNACCEGLVAKKTKNGGV